MGYFLLDAEVTIARDGEPAFRSFITDVQVDPAARPSRRYTYGDAYQDETGTLYLEPRETLAWHELILAEDKIKLPGFSEPAETAKLARGKAIYEARLNVLRAETELRKLEY